MRTHRFPISVNALGNGTAQTDRPISGHIVSMRMDGTAFGSTADYTFTRTQDNGTVLNVANAVAPWQFQPRDTLHTAAGGSALAAAGSPGIPIDSFLKCVVAQATPNASADVIVYYLED